MIFKTTALILNTKDYSFDRFKHKGMGGSTKYIATAKTDVFPRKLIVKHNCEYAVASNGFVFARIGELLGMTMPKTYMFYNSTAKKGIFESPCVMGMEFIEGLQPIDIDTIKATEKLKRSYVEYFVLHSLLSDFSDSVQYAYVPNDTLYPFDFDESFQFEKGFFHFILKFGESAEKEVAQKLRYISSKGAIFNLNVCYKVLCDNLGYDKEKKDIPYFFEILERFCNLTKDEIYSVTDALDFLPDLISFYYEEYIQIMQRSTAEYLKMNRP